MNEEVNAKRLTTLIFFAKGDDGESVYVRDHRGMGAANPAMRIEGRYFLTAKNLTLRVWKSANPKDYFDERYTFRFEGSEEKERLILGGGKRPTAILRRLPSYCIASASAAEDCAETKHSCKSTIEWGCEEHVCTASCD